MMLWCLLAAAVVGGGGGGGVLAQTTYDAYFAKPVSDTRTNFLLNVVNASTLCTVQVQACKKHEERRVDGTCTNPKFPSRGATISPLLRMLPPRFGVGNSLRPAGNGSDLPSTRQIRTNILSDGLVSDHHFSSLSSILLVFSTVDFVDLVYFLRYLLVSTCCLGNQPTPIDPNCIPIPVPDNDPYLRETGIRCLNLTRVETYQDYGCIPRTLPYERYNRATPQQDLSVIYGNTNDRQLVIRSFSGGELRVVPGKDGAERPPPTAPFCIGNQRQQGETACYEFGDNFQGNLLQGVYTTGQWFFREHNRLARGLAKINPCWDDQELFEIARKINIGQYQKIYYYDLMKLLLGKENAYKTGILHHSHGYVNAFNESCKPGLYHEFTVGTRWLHIMQEGRADQYSNDGQLNGQRYQVQDAVRSGILEINNNEQRLTQGYLRQPAAKIDYIFDIDLAERVAGPLRASDLPATDMMRSRDQGLPPYNEYRKLCGYPVAHKWEDFHDTIDPDMVEELRRIYFDVDDVDVMVAMYAEKLMAGSWVPPTLFCIMHTQLVSWRRSDRFFFEEGHGGSPFTLEQLAEIRNTSIARILCDSGIGVDSIQPEAFLRIEEGNEMVPCKDIPGINLWKWHDHEHGKCERIPQEGIGNLLGNFSNIQLPIPGIQLPIPGIPIGNTPNMQQPVPGNLLANLPLPQLPQPPIP